MEEASENLVIVALHFVFNYSILPTKTAGLCAAGRLLHLDVLQGGCILYKLLYCLCGISTRQLETIVLEC